MSAPAPPEPPPRPTRAGIGPFLRRLLVVVGVVLVVVFLWKISRAVLLTFAAVLFAVLLRSLAEPVARRSPLSARAAVLATAAVLVALFVLFGWFIGPRIAGQFEQFVGGLPQTVEAAQAQIRQYPWGEFVLGRIGGGGGSLGVMGPLQQAASMVWTAVFDGIVIFFVGLFLALTPGRYVGGLAMLIPAPWDRRVSDALETTGRMLQRWLLGKVLAMLLVGVLTGLGLWVLGVPLALALGFLAFLFDFVPFFGPTAAALPGILLAFTISPMRAFYVALLYLGIQQLEGNVITPLVQQEAVGLPPALILLSVLVGGLLFGILGALVAVPAAVAATTLVKLLYVRDVLGKDVEVEAEE
ncbi:MAG: AI-2E family transporter [Rhodothermales bacterium]|nr:AI-2E family transporter [Rhodothermales bacterium]